MGEVLALENGLEFPDLVVSARRARTCAQRGAGLPVEQTEQWTDEDMAGLADAAAFVLQSSDSDQPFKARELAQQVYAKWWDRNMEFLPNQRWENLSAREKFVWEAVARHLVTLIDSDDDQVSDLAWHESQWEIWAKDRAGKLVTLVGANP